MALFHVRDGQSESRALFLQLLQVALILVIEIRQWNRERADRFQGSFLSLRCSDCTSIIKSLRLSSFVSQKLRPSLASGVRMCWDWGCRIACNLHSKRNPTAEPPPTPRRFEHPPSSCSAPAGPPV